MVMSGWVSGGCGKVAQDDPTCSSTDAISACDGDVRWGPSGPHDSGSFGCRGGGGFQLSASVATSVIKEFVSGSVLASPTGETSAAVAQPRMPDLSREGPFDIHQDCSTSGASPWVLDSMRAVSTA